MDKDLSKVKGIWKRHHRSTVFRDRESDPLCLDIVCVPGYPLAYNKMFHHFQLRGLQRMEQALSRSGGKIKGNSVLDLGCGTGRWCKYFQQKSASHITGVDISQHRLVDNKEREPTITFKKMSITELDFPDKTFDILNISWVLQHNTHPLQEKILTNRSIFLIEMTSE